LKFEALAFQSRSLWKEMMDNSLQPAGEARNRIARITATPVFVRGALEVGPVTKPAPLSAVVVEIETQDGLVGHGFTAITEEEIISAAIRDVVTPNLIGQDALNREAISEFLYWLLTPRGQTGYASHVISAIDIALWDILGRRLGLPVWRLLGGARNKVPLYRTFGFGGFDRDELTAAARWLRDAGHRRLKMVVGAHATAKRDERSVDAVIAEDVRRVRAVRDAVGEDVEIFVDANCNLDSFSALKLAREIAKYGVTFFEEPIRGNDTGRLADLRRQSPIPIAAGQNEGQLFRFRDLLAADAVDVLQPNVCICGGYTAAAKAAALAQAFGVPIDNGGAFPFHNMHLHAGLANGGMVEWHLLSVTMGQVLYTNLPEANVDELVLPDVPGLGFELNVDVVRELGRAPSSAGRGKG
jgi:L-rhamnonate dehydratase